MLAPAPTGTPTRPDCLARRTRVASCDRVRLCLRKDHRPKRAQASACGPSAFYLQPTPPRRRFNHARDNARTGYQPAAVAVPALISFFILRVPWVSWFPSMAITFLGAAVRPSYLNKGLTDKVRPLISGYESRRSPYRETVACPQGLGPIGPLPKFRHRPSQKDLPASPYGPLMVELFAFADLLRYPGASPPGAVHCWTRGSPRRTTLNEPSGPEPRVWITPCLDGKASPTLKTDGLRQNSIASCSASPPFGAKKMK